MLLSSAEVIQRLRKNRVRHMASRPQARPRLVVSRGNNTVPGLRFVGMKIRYHDLPSAAHATASNPF